MVLVDRETFSWLKVQLYGLENGSCFLSGNDAIVGAIFDAKGDLMVTHRKIGRQGRCVTNSFNGG